ncbi:MAG: quinone-dependent dihydroorotate dehydrogenase, partial [Salinibacter sp.]
MYQLLRPLLFRMSPEQAHTASLWAARMAQRTVLPLVASQYRFEDERLKQRLWGNTFPSPVGLAAGADKNAQAVPFWEAVGFGFVEVGSVSARPAAGNPTPRAFRLPEDQALINRLGLNNEGAEAVAERLEQGRSDRSRPLGVNLAKTHDPDIMGEAALEDFRTSFRHLVGPADYVTLNVSCPNTPDGGTFEDPAALDTLLDAIAAEQKAPGLAVPVLIKLSPPLSDRVLFDTRLEEILAVTTAHDVDGFIATNTAPDRQGVQTSDERLEEIGAGGLSGPPLEDRATRLVQYLYRATDGEIPIVGVGGVHDAASAYAKIRAGASL